MSTHPEVVARNGRLRQHSVMLDFGLLLARILPFFMLGHGLKKAADFGAFVDNIRDMPVAEPAPEFIGFLVVAGEIVLPILVALGLLTRVAAFFEALMMALIWWFGPVTNSFNEGGGIIARTGGPVGENTIAYVFVLLPLVFTGPGRISMDHMIFGRRKRAATTSAA